METYTLSHFPLSFSTIHVALFRNLQNASEIRRRLITASTMEGASGDEARQEVDFGFAEAALVSPLPLSTKKLTNHIVSREHLLTAIQSTILNSLSPNPTDPASYILKTRSHNLHSELLLTLSPNNNITDSIRRHGLSDNTKDLLVVRIGPPENQEAIFQAISAVVKGELRSMDELDRGECTDWSKVDKAYKLGEMNQLKLPDPTNAKIGAVINTVAIKSVT